MSGICGDLTIILDKYKINLLNIKNIGVDLFEGNGDK